MYVHKNGKKKKENKKQKKGWGGKNDQQFITKTRTKVNTVYVYHTKIHEHQIKQITGGVKYQRVIILCGFCFILHISNIM